MPFLLANSLAKQRENRGIKRQNTFAQSCAKNAKNVGKSKKKALLQGLLRGRGDRILSVDFYWHTLSVKGKGLSYCGITLIPPSSLKAFIDAITDNSELSKLKELLEKAMDSNKWVIHYGL